MLDTVVLLNIFMQTMMHFFRILEILNELKVNLFEIGILCNIIKFYPKSSLLFIYLNFD